MLFQAGLTWEQPEFWNKSDDNKNVILVHSANLKQQFQLNPFEIKTTNNHEQNIH